MIKYYLAKDPVFAAALSSDRYNNKHLVVLYKLHLLDHFLGINDLPTVIYGLNNCSPDWELILSEALDPEEKRRKFHQEFLDELTAFSLMALSELNIPKSSIEQSVLEILELDW